MRGEISAYLLVRLWETCHVESMHGDTEEENTVIQKLMSLSKKTEPQPLRVWLAFYGFWHSDNAARLLTSSPTKHNSHNFVTWNWWCAFIQWEQAAGARGPQGQTFGCSSSNLTDLCKSNNTLLPKVIHCCSSKLHKEQQKDFDVLRAQEILTCVSQRLENRPEKKWPESISVSLNDEKDLLLAYSLQSNHYQFNHTDWCLTPNPCALASGKETIVGWVCHVAVLLIALF